MKGDQPEWMKKGEANRAKLDSSTLHRVLIPPTEFQYSGTNFDNESLRKSQGLEVSEHLIDLWTVLRKITKIVLLTTVTILILPGIHDGNLSYNEPLVLQILNYIIAFTLQSITASGEIEAQVFIGSPMTLISLYLNLAFFIATTLSIPLIIKELLEFAKPGLTEKEFEVIKQAIVYAIVFFILGAAISYFVILPIMLKFLVLSGGIIGQQSLLQLYSLSSIVNLLLWGTLGGGLLYASPTILIVLVNLGIMNPDEIQSRRKEIYFGMFIFSALITVDPTMFSMIILSVPMILIIEGIIIWTYKLQLEQITHGVYS